MFVASLLVFILVRLSPLDAAGTLAGRGATAEQIAEIRERLGLDAPVVQQYLTWLWNALRGDFGDSLVVQGQTVSGLIGASLGPTIALVTGAMLIASVVGVALGILAALRPRTRLDRLVTGGTVFGVALPEFVLATVLVAIFAVKLGWFPAVGYVPLGTSVRGWFEHLLLGWVALAAAPAAEITLQTRYALGALLSPDYILSARAKGLRARVVVGKHALKNAGSTIVTVIGLWAGRLIGSAVLIEFVFAIPGFGLLTVQAVQRHDYPLIQGAVLVSAVAVLAINLLADLADSYLNPKGAAHR
jgi:peptide/nickel transport system permease protein